MRVQRSWRLLLLGFLILAVLLFPVVAAAQSCALCYTQAASSTQRFIAALRSGIIILIIPPMFMSIGITVLAYRKRNQFKDGGDLPTGADPGC
ncbi:MAG: hypothetical protein WA188_15040 [Terriglobales bacterium]